MQRLPLLLVCVLFFCKTLNARQLPDYIQKCKRNDPNVAKCVQKSVEDLRPRLKDGIEELGVPSLDPFYISELNVFRRDDKERNTHFYLDLRDLSVTGASNFLINKLKLDIPNFTYRIGINIPHLDIVGKYDVDARILVVPIKGSGDLYVNASNIEGDAVLKGTLIKSGDKNIMDFTELTLKLNINDYFVHLQNLFEGDPVLGQAANQILNTNSKEYIQIVTPIIEQKVAEILLEAAKNIVKNVDYDETFPAE